MGDRPWSRIVEAGLPYVFGMDPDTVVASRTQLAELATRANVDVPGVSMVSPLNLVEQSDGTGSEPSRLAALNADGVGEPSAID